MNGAPARRVAAAVIASMATSVARGLLDFQPPGGQARWTRLNYSGQRVSILAGPAVAAGLLASTLAAPSPRAAAALAVAVGSGAGFGMVDDLHEDTSSREKGLRGHLRALAHGHVSTGAVKVLGIGAGGLLAAALAPPQTREGPRRGWPGVADVLASGALIAATANVVNLFDLRPGRALKAVTLAAVPLAVAGGTGAPAAGALLGAGWSAAEADLGELDMLGDGGANALGAALGTAVVLGGSRRVRLAWLTGALALTVASERVSFGRVIERTPVLRELDAWGRRPAAPSGAGRR